VRVKSLDSRRSKNPCTSGRGVVKTESPNLEAAFQRLTNQISDLAVHVVESARNHDAALAKINATLDRVTESQIRHEQALDKVNQTLDRVAESQEKDRELVSQLAEIATKQANTVQALIAQRN
jgi:chromosome segregation ATPase